MAQRRLSAWQWYVFYQQLQRLLTAGLNLVATLELLTHQAQVVKLRELSGFLAHSVLRGLSLTEAARLSQDFAVLDLQLLAVGEISGHLTTVLGVLATYYERRHQFRAQLKKALSYPLFLLLLSVLVLIVMLTMLVPQFTQLFNNAGVPLPLLTRIIMRLADFVMIALAVSGFIVFGFILAVKLVSQRRADLLELVIQGLPIIGKLWQRIIWQRFCQSLGLMLQALPLVGAASGSVLCESSLFMIAKELHQGIGLQKAFEHQVFFPRLLILLIAIGENTGRLDEILLQQATSFEQELLQALSALSQWLEPLLLIGVGVIVGVIVIAMYLPIFEMARVF